jgi:hypothetical protein
VLTPLALGFALGLRHAVDPDHVIAVSTLVARDRGAWRATWLGLSWGVGHGATVIAVGVVVIALRVAIPEALARWLELAVGIMLVALGVANLAAVPPGPDGHAPRRPSLPACLARSGVVGFVHGLAGSAAVALLAAAAMPTAGAALIYLLAFDLGALGGMVVFTALAGVPFAILGDRIGPRRLLTAATGCLSLLFGGTLICDFGLPAVPWLAS